MAVLKQLRSADVARKLSDIGRSFGLVWSACGGWTLLWTALLVAQGILPVASVQLTRKLVDGLTAAVASGDPGPFSLSSSLAG